MSSGTAAPAVGVLGGTFDPVHLGHLTIAERAREMLGVSRMLLVPTAIPPHKPREALSPPACRLAMLRLALADRPGLELSTIEMSEDRVSFTYDTLCRLADAADPCRPIFVLGMDALCEIESWHESRKLLERFDLAAIGRPEGRPERLPIPAIARARLVEAPPGSRAPAAWLSFDPGRGGRIFVLPIGPIPISSSLVRQRVEQGGDLSGLVPPGVARYIHEARLYREGEPH